ncbi:hypothetical protein E2562_024803 [Oryza meyeriana var. granulata]|uniref:Uncharacterized protein n=1 Tax=Oryza meyeriana var. granulata TaxID=110450 RepID=A0A6G1FBR2_9ORYZ|nr:hypothetical protein E2562_024803 [Oryza meyeriana var. granulata]
MRPRPSGSQEAWQGPWEGMPPPGGAPSTGVSAAAGGTAPLLAPPPSSPPHRARHRRMCSRRNLFLIELHAEPGAKTSRDELDAVACAQWLSSLHLHWRRRPSLQLPRRRWASLPLPQRRRPSRYFPRQRRLDSLAALVIVVMMESPLAARSAGGATATYVAPRCS